MIRLFVTGLFALSLIQPSFGQAGSCGTTGVCPPPQNGTNITNGVSRSPLPSLSPAPYNGTRNNTTYLSSSPLPCCPFGSPGCGQGVPVCPNNATNPTGSVPPSSSPKLSNPSRSPDPTPKPSESPTSSSVPSSAPSGAPSLPPSKSVAPSVAPSSPPSAVPSSPPSRSAAPSEGPSPLASRSAPPSDVSSPPSVVPSPKDPSKSVAPSEGASPLASRSAPPPVSKSAAPTLYFRATSSRVPNPLSTLTGANNRPLNLTLQFGGANGTAMTQGGALQQVQAAAGCTFQVPLENVVLTNITQTTGGLVTTVPFDRTIPTLNSNGTVVCLVPATAPATAPANRRLLSARALQTSSSVDVFVMILSPSNDLLALNSTAFASLVQNS